MRLPRPQLTVRWMLAAVAALAVALALGIEAERLSRIARYRQKKADEYRVWEELHIKINDDHINNLGTPFKAALDRAKVYKENRLKWENAAAHPWLPAPPDPFLFGPKLRPAYHIDRGNYRQALVDLEGLHSLNPEDADDFNLHAWLLATCPDERFRDGKHAVSLAKRACELSPVVNAAILDTLAAAYAEAGEFSSAIRTEQEALGLVPPSDPERQGYIDRLKLFKSSKPYRFEPPPE